MGTVKLTDQDGNACYFDEQALTEQLAFSGLPPSGSAALKNVVRNFATAVSEMRMAQTRYFGIPYQDPNKQAALTEAKRHEANVAKMLQFINQTIDRV
jgi:hypothetical protein